MNDILELRLFYIREHKAKESDGGSPIAQETVIPDSVASFFRRLSLESFYLPAVGDDIFVPSLRDLSKGQWGYSYHPRLQKKIDGWPDDWFVIAHQGASPFVFDVRSERVGLAYLTADSNWDATFVFSRLIDFFWAIGIAAQIKNNSNNRYFDGPMPGEMLSTAKEKLAEKIPEDISDDVLTVLGWSDD